MLIREKGLSGFYFKKRKNAGIVCLKCGISQPTLRKWLRLYEQKGIEGLKNKSRRPFHFPSKKITPKIEQLILNLRKKRKLGVKELGANFIDFMAFLFRSPLSIKF